MNCNAYLAEMEELKTLAKPLVQYLGKHFDPYTKIEVSRMGIDVFNTAVHLPIETDETDVEAK